MNDPYTPELLARAEASHPFPTMITHQATAQSRYCADRIHLGLRIVEGRVEASGWQGYACAVCRASANSLCAGWIGDEASSLDRLDAELQQALDGGDSEAFSALRSLEAVPGRHACARLPLDVARLALDPSDPGRDPSAPGPDASTPLAPDAWGAAMDFRARGLEVAIATLVEVVGSSPCPVGSHVVVASNGEFWGAVSGGCVEAAVVHAGLAVLEGRRAPGTDTFQISNSQAGELGLPCGGQVLIHLGLAPGDAQLRRYRARGRGLARVVDLAGGVERLQADPAPGPRRRDNSFVQPLVAPSRLILVGGTRIAQVLAGLAGTVGYEVVIVEPRPGFAGPGRFQTQVVNELPQDALPGLLSERSAVVMLTHDARLDDPALRVALRSEAFYVGALGSRKTQRARLERLALAGLDPHELARLHGPAGLAIGAVGAEEIAVSILAEVISERRRTAPREVGIVVLAAGSSQRAGPANKLLQEIDGRPMIRAVVQTALATRAGPCIVVLGHEADAVRDTLADLPVQFVHNASFADGMGASIATGIEAIAAHGVSAALVMLGDMPFVSEASLRAILEAHTPATRHLVVVPVAGAGDQRRRANPVLWPARYFVDLQRLSGDEGGRAILSRAPGIVLELDVDDPGVLHDVDGILGM